MASISMLAFAALGQETAVRHGGAAEDGLPTAEEQLRVLSEKLDRYELGPHPEMHGSLSGTPNRPVQ